MPGADRAVLEHEIEAYVPPRPGARRPRCVSLFKPVGITHSGTPLLPPTDRGGLDLGARQAEDACGGTISAAGLYGFLRRAPCVDDPGSGHSGEIAVARDGIPIFGPRGRRGKLVRNSQLDRCHGHRHGRARVATLRKYHYHQTREFPYFVGCFRAKPRPWHVATLAPKQGGVSITPAPEPAFDRAISDYVIDCAAGPIRLELESGTGRVVTIGKGGPVSGAVSVARDLRPGQGLRFSLEDGVGAIEYSLRCLPADFPRWSFESEATPEQAFYAVTPILSPWVIIFDRNGVPVWWFEDDRMTMDAKLLSDGTVAWSHFPGTGFAARPGADYEIHALNGVHTRSVAAVGNPTDFHDLQEAGGGNLLLLTYRPRDHVDLSAHGGPADATVVDAEIQEIAPDGSLVWSWNSRDEIELSETGRWWPWVLSSPTPLPGGRNAYDIVHINSVEADGDSVVLSARHLDAVYSIDRGSGEVEWKLGGTDTPESLTVTGDPHGANPLGGQHDARVLGDGSLTVFDNATDFGRPPRAVRYEIDAGTGTATLLEAIADPEAVTSTCCGSARRSPSGSWLISWGGSAELVTEVSPAGGRSFKLDFEAPYPFSYRAFPIAPGTVSAAALRDGMDAMAPP